MFSKKGSLNLSIQAIVILVMAMALLGLGLGFIRTMFASGTNKLIGELDNINIMQASDSQPIVMTNTVKINKGKYAQLQVSLYNKDGATNYDINTNGVFKCGTGDSITVTCPAKVSMPLRESTSFGCAVSAASTATEGLFTCQFTTAATDGNSLSGSFFVEVSV
ncbi:MAG: hypothetical protein ABIC91_04530 [Nanoarchaeota archaeon]|nr:hypothetical protein [Nanoarchaeota archaeon]MBU1850435.1 hypothetical protein [Nanoarchaeota archaeon]